MSPEQARGKTVDKRADIWAFGAVLYEMLTGRKPFEGATVSDMLAAVLTREPDWSALPPATPPGVRRLLRLCLEKDAKKRLHDIGDAWLFAADGPGPSAVDARLRFGWLSVAAIALAAAGIAVLVMWSLRARTVPSPTRKFEFAIDRLDPATAPSISPDGRKILYVAGGSLWVRELDRGGDREVVHESAPQFPIWSPDGAQIAYVAKAKLWKVPISGGAPSVIAPASFREMGLNAGAVWMEDGRIVFAPAATGYGLLAVSADGGDLRPILERDKNKEEDLHKPSLLPGGPRDSVHQRPCGWRTVRDGGPLGQHPQSGPGAEGRPTGLPRVFADGAHPLLPEDDLDGRDLGCSRSRWRSWKRPASPSSSPETRTGRASPRTGCLSSRARRSTSSSWRSWTRVDESSATSVLPVEFRRISGPRFRPMAAGSLSAPRTRTKAGTSTFAISTRSDLTRLTIGSAGRCDADMASFWRPGDLAATASRLDKDGIRRTRFGRHWPGASARRRCVIRRRLTGRQNPPLHPAAAQHRIRPSPASFGERASLRRKSRARFWKRRSTSHLLGSRPTGTSWRTSRTMETSITSTSGRFRPARSDGRASFEGGWWPAWSRSGNRLFYVHDDDLMEVTISTTPSLKLGAPRRLFSGKEAGLLVEGRFFDISSAGSFAFVRAIKSEHPPTLTVVENWLTDFRDRPKK